MPNILALPAGEPALIKVDRYGNQIDRFQEGDPELWAHPPLPVEIQTTHPKYTNLAKPDLPDPGSPVAKAILLVSQTKHGRELLQQVLDKRVTMRYYSESEKPSDNTFAEYRHSDNTILFPQSTDLSFILGARVLVEELTHAKDHAKPLNLRGWPSFRSDIMLTRALEASAKAAQFRFAADYALINTNDQTRFFTPSLFTQLQQDYPNCYQEAQRSFDLIEKGRPDLFVRNVFVKFYEELHQLEGYDKIVLTGMIDGARRNSSLSTIIYSRKFHDYFMNGADATHDVIADWLTVDGRKFLKGAPFSLDDFRFRELTSGPQVQALKQELDTILDHDIGYRVGKMFGHDTRPDTKAPFLRGLLGPGTSSRPNTPDV